jgi:small nuclear ribonucleoprotein D3
MAEKSAPIKVLHEGEGHKVTVQLKNGEEYRGLLTKAEDNMNVHLSKVVMVGRDGQSRKLESVFLRGSTVRYFVLPDILKEAPIFKKVQTMVEKANESAKEVRSSKKK